MSCYDPIFLSLSELSFSQRVWSHQIAAPLGCKCSLPHTHIAAAGLQPVSPRPWTVTLALLPNCTLLRLKCPHVPSLHGHKHILSEVLITSGSALTLFCLGFPCAQHSSGSQHSRHCSVRGIPLAAFSYSEERPPGLYSAGYDVFSCAHLALCQD